jgi:hypothetical protein
MDAGKRQGQGRGEPVMSDHDHDHSGGAGHGHATSGSYTCPMHPEVSRAEPGKCPICGMTLVRRAPAAGQKT